MDKAEKKRLQQEMRQKEKQAFTESLPMSKEHFQELFDYLDESFEEQECDHTLRLTLEFLADRSIPADNVVAWLKEHGGYCDCEALANVEEKFD